MLIEATDILIETNYDDHLSSQRQLQQQQKKLEELQEESKRRKHPPRSLAIQKMHKSVQSRPSHLPPIDYGENHPFDTYHHHYSHSSSNSHSSSRYLQVVDDDNFDEKSVYPRNDDLFKQIRIKFEYTNLKTRGTHKDEVRIKTLKSTVLPAMGMFYKHLLSVIPIEGTLPVADGECFGYVDVPQTLRRRGADDVDLLIFVAGFDSVGGSTICSRNSGILAAASSCSLDQHDRPITGFINFCLDEIKVNQLGSIFESDINNLIAVGIHEFAHVLGFNGESWKFFRHPLSGEPLTKRPFRKQLYTCVNGETYRDIIVPSCHTLNEGIAANGMPYFELVTPTVRQVVRNQFGCQSLNGARLENQPTNEFDCFGTHWEERYFYSETLSAYYAPEANYFSALTLAVLEDSGWYRANYTNAKTSPFGHGAGCDFVEKKCIDRNKVPSYGEGFFCDNPIEQYRNGDFKIEYTCDPSHKLKAGCDLMRKMRDPPLPKEGQYFTDPFLGIFVFDSADYCPIAQIDTRDCRNSINNQRFKLSPGETYGPDSLCYDAAINNFGSTTRSKTSLCLESKCNPNTQHLEVYVYGQTLICQFSFQRIGFIYMGKEIRLTCPRLMAACPDLFCPANCAGRGICNYNAEFPVCECFDQEDNSLNCENSPMLVPSMTEDVCTASSLRVPVLPFDWDWDWNWNWFGTARRIMMIITTFGIPLLTTMGLLICNI